MTQQEWYEKRPCDDPKRVVATYKGRVGGLGAALAAALNAEEEDAALRAERERELKQGKAAKLGAGLAAVENAKRAA